jgi:hypothetical protein
VATYFKFCEGFGFVDEHRNTTYREVNVLNIDLRGITVIPHVPNQHGKTPFKEMRPPTKN